MILKTVLGPAFAALPPLLQQFHAGSSARQYSGKADITRGSRFASLLCDLGGFPAAGQGVPLRMHIRADDAAETWIRDFNGHVLTSVLRRYDTQHVIERFGPFEVIMRPAVHEGALDMPVVGLRGAGLAVPSRFLGQSGGREQVSQDGRIHFEVSSALPFVGPMISYSGTLAPD